ncbi:MAG: DUF2721 domain-containing protein [Phycisphaeraceae bacterium]|nr:MAG: DUF2721 domain-containing protein [Phycisphaeraceae bacterium]
MTPATQPDTAVVISQLVAPVVMISANGLLCLALFNRLATLVARSRAFAKERVELLRAQDQPHPGPTGASLDQIRLEALSAHAARVLKRAQLLRFALQCLLFSVLAMLASSAAIGLSLASHSLWFVALFAFALGVLAMAVGVVLVMTELAQALRDAQLEDRILTQLESLAGNSTQSEPRA